MRGQKFSEASMLDSGRTVRWGSSCGVSCVIRKCLQTLDLERCLSW